MKKLMLILLAAAMLMGCALAEAPTETPAPTPSSDLIAVPDATRRPIETATPRPADAPLPADPFLGHAVEIARRLDLLADSGVFYTYCNRSGASPEVWDFVSRGDHTTPAHIYTLSGETLMLGLTGGDPSDTPWFDLSRTPLRRDIVATLPDMMFVGMDKEVVSCIRMLARYKIFASDMPDDCGLMVMLYDDGTPIVLHWYSERGAVSISAYFVPDAALEACASAEDVAAWFAGLNMPLVTFEEAIW